MLQHKPDLKSSVSTLYQSGVPYRKT